MKRKGFTLIEMLGVFTLLALILFLSIPTITGTLKKQKENTYEKFLSDLYLATEAYVQSHTEYNLSVQDQRLYIKLEDVVEANYLKSTVINPKTKEKINLEHYIEIYVDEEYNLHYAYMEEVPEIIS